MCLSSCLIKHTSVGHLQPKPKASVRVDRLSVRSSWTKTEYTKLPRKNQEGWGYRNMKIPKWVGYKIERQTIKETETTEERKTFRSFGYIRNRELRI